MNAEAERCRENLERCLRHVLTGKPPEGWLDQTHYAGSERSSWEGALQGWADWAAELELCEQEERS